MGGEDRNLRSGGIENRILTIEDTLKAMQQQLKLLDKLKGLGKISTDVTDLKSAVSEISVKILDLERNSQEVAQLKSEMNSVKAELLQSSHQVEDMRNEMENLHRFMHRQEIEISGFPDLKGTTPKKVFLALAAKASLSLSDGDLLSCIERQKGNQRRVIISVKFALAEKRDMFMKKVKALRLSTVDFGMSVRQNIFVNEILSFRMRKLLFQVKEAAKTNSWKSVWVYAGRAMLKRSESDTPIQLMSEKDLITLLK